MKLLMKCMAVLMAMIWAGYAVAAMVYAFRNDSIGAAVVSVVLTLLACLFYANRNEQYDGER